MKDPLLQRLLVKERCRTQAKHSHASGVQASKVQLSTQSLQMLSHALQDSHVDGQIGTKNSLLSVKGDRCPLGD